MVTGALAAISVVVLWCCVGTRSGDEDIFVTLISVSNCAGRLLSGFVSDLGVNRSRGRISRPWFLAGACVVMAASFLLVTLWSSLASLYIACVLIGMAYGAINALNPATASEIFGLKSFGSIYGLCLPFRRRRFCS